MNQEHIPFQLSSRTISVAYQEGKPERYSFQAVIIETSTKHAATLKERLFALDPTMGRTEFPYSGKYPFIPLLKSQEWSITKIYQLARATHKNYWKFEASLSF
jgi:hypothetical protein